MCGIQSKVTPQNNGNNDNNNNYYYYYQTHQDKMCDKRQEKETYKRSRYCSFQTQTFKQLD